MARTQRKSTEENRIAGPQKGRIAMAKVSNRETWCKSPEFYEVIRSLVPPFFPSCATCTRCLRLDLSVTASRNHRASNLPVGLNCKQTPGGVVCDSNHYLRVVGRVPRCGHVKFSDVHSTVAPDRSGDKIKPRVAAAGIPWKLADVPLMPCFTTDSKVRP